MHKKQGIQILKMQRLLDGFFSQVQKKEGKQVVEMQIRIRRN
jgi:hypothetical protein